MDAGVAVWGLRRFQGRFRRFYGERRWERRNLPRRARVRDQRSAGLARRRRRDAAWAGVAEAGLDQGGAWAFSRAGLAQDNPGYDGVVPLAG